jgi:hypothetical protein
MPRLRAFTRSAASVRLVNLAISLTGVFAFECARSSFRSALLYSRRTRFLGAFTAFFAFLTVFFTFLATVLSRLFWNHLLPIDCYTPQGDIYRAAPPAEPYYHLPPWHGRAVANRACCVFVASDEAFMVVECALAEIGKTKEVQQTYFG